MVVQETAREMRMPRERKGVGALEKERRHAIGEDRFPGRQECKRIGLACRDRSDVSRDCL